MLGCSSSVCLKGAGKVWWGAWGRHVTGAALAGGWGALTNGCLTELLIGHLVGNVGPHQHTHGDAQVLPNHFRDELQPIGALVYPLGTGWSSGQVPFMPN